MALRCFPLLVGCHFQRYINHAPSAGFPTIPTQHPSSQWQSRSNLNPRNTTDLSAMNVIPSPLQLMNALGSMANVKQIARCLSAFSTAGKPFSPLDYDVHPSTGCFPPEPLPSLPSQFSLWEVALAEAQEALCLGADESEAALAKRPRGALWREQIQTVSSCVFRRKTVRSHILLVARARHQCPPR